MAGQPPKNLKDALNVLMLRDPSEPKQNYAFWETQPVAQFNSSNAHEASDGPIDKLKTVDQVQKEQYTLPVNFEWCTCDINNDAELKEIYELLSNHYVEDDDNMFRFAYSKEFLRWALGSPGYLADWHSGVRVTATGKLVAFISAIPAKIRVKGNVLDMVEINFLCIHKKLRQKRLAPLLIREITRRVNQQNVWQAVYTAGVVLPKPVAEAQYWHRSLNPKKLIAVGFSRLAPRMTMARTLKLYKLPDRPLTPGVRPMQSVDVPSVTKLLQEYLTKYALAPLLTEEDVAHWMLPQENVIYSYVVESPFSGEITDLFSFYTLPSTIIGNAEYNSLRAAYMFYTVPKTSSVEEILHDALIMANSTGHDVFNALDIFENKEILRDLKFGIGDGKLRYYLYNWRVVQELEPSDVGLVML